jgi:hypothetical protein
MALPTTTAIATAFLRLFVALAVAAWSVYSLRKLYEAVRDLRQNWGKWDTYPVPDMRACYNLAILLVLLAGWALFTAGLTFALGWVLGV